MISRIITFLLALCTLPASAATIHWTNNLGGNWNTAANWSPNTVPTSSDVAVVTNDGTYSVVVNVDPIVSGLTIGGASGTQTLSMISGHMTVNGPASIGAQAHLSLNGGTLSVTNGLTLNGTMVWAGGALPFATTLTVASNGVLVWMGGTLGGTLSNAGTIVWKGGAITVQLAGLLHNLSGALLEVRHESPESGSLTGGTIVNDGTIRKTAGPGTAAFEGRPFVNNGVMDVRVGTMRLGRDDSTTTVLGEGSSYVGVGTNLFSGDVTLAGSFTSENLVATGSFVYMDGSGTLHGFMSFQVNLVNDAALAVAPNAILHLNSSVLLHGSLTNGGTVVLKNSYISFRGIVHNLSSGTFDVTGDYTFNGNGTGKMINDGIYRKSAGNGTNSIQASVPFINNGIVLVQTGTVSFSSNLTNPVGTLAVMGGKIRSETPLILPEGMITGSGIIEAPSITSAALINPGATNAVLILSGSYTQQLGGAIEFDIGGTNVGTDQSQVIVTGGAHLNGSVGVRFSPGYSPSVGSRNVVLTAASLTGDFKCLNGFLLLGEDKRMNVAYSPTNVVLTTISAPDPIGPTLSIARDHQTMICWPSEFAGYALHFKTNLNTGEWIPIPATTNRYLDSSFAPQKYFQLIKRP